MDNQASNSGAPQGEPVKVTVSSSDAFTAEQEPVTGSNTPAPATPSGPAPMPPAEPAEPTPAAPVVAPAPAVVPKKKKKWLPWVIAAAVVLLGGGGAGAYYYFGVFQNPENVLYDAYSHIAAAKAMQMGGTIGVTMPTTSGFKVKSIDYKGNFENNPSGMMAITVKASLHGADISVGGKGMMLDNGDVYFQLTGLNDAFKEYARAAGHESDVPSSFYTALGKLQDQWVKVSASELTGGSADAAKGYQCVLDAYKKHKDDDAKPLLDAYKKNTFVVKTGDAGTKDGLMGYKLKFDKEKAKAFAESIKDTGLYKDLKACGGSSSTSTATDESNLDNTDLTFWVDQWSHELKAIDYSGSNGSGSSEVSFNGTMKLAYDKNVTTTAPSSSIGMDEFKTRVEDVMMELQGGGSTIEDSVANSI